MLKIFFSLLFSCLIINFSWWSMTFFMCILMFLVLMNISVEEGTKFIGYMTNFDGVSFSLCYLSVWLSVVMMTASMNILKQHNSSSMFSLFVSALLLILLLSFTTNNYLLFYFFFESSLIPTLLIITGWGYQPERLQAGIYFILYTLTASLPLLLSLFYLFYYTGSLVMDSSVFILTKQDSFYSILLSLGLLMAFLVKMPMFMFHLWLPKAHVEAPVAGSMILAGVLLKLGGYGMFRVLNKWYFSLMKLSPYLVALSLLSMVYVGYMCCRLSDMKALVAYSSVAHMGLMLASLSTNYFWGLLGGLMVMVSHGLASSGLFCIVNIYYERSGSRSLYINSGLLLMFPTMSLMMFFLCASNISAPPAINLLSEFFLMASVLSYDNFMMFVFPLGSFMGAVFTLYLFSYSQHGKIYATMSNLNSMSFIENHSLMLHIIPLNILILKSEVFFYCV